MIPLLLGYAAEQNWRELKRPVAQNLIADKLQRFPLLVTGRRDNGITASLAALSIAADRLPADEASRQIGAIAILA